MRAAINRQYGPPEVVRIEEVAKPVIGPEHADRVIVKVHSASINPFDYIIRSGYLPVRLLGGKLKPDTTLLGVDVAGTVDAVGPAVTRFKVGDRVFGGCLGSHAEYVRAREGSLTLLPASMSYDQGAALSCAATTALQALRDVAHVQPGQRVLIYGASGGIGHFAVQLAKHFGAHVTAVCSTGNLGWVKALGADEVIDYTQTDFAKTGRRYDLIHDTVGKRTYAGCKRALTPGGLYISEHFFTPFPAQLPQLLWAKLTRDRRFQIHIAKPNTEDLNCFRELIEAGELRPVIEQVYPLEQIAAAHRHIEGRHTKGKVIVQVAPLN